MNNEYETSARVGSTIEQGNCSIEQSELQRRINGLAELSGMSEVLNENLVQVGDRVFGERPENTSVGCQAVMDSGGQLHCIDLMIDQIQSNLNNAMRATERLQAL